MLELTGREAEQRLRRAQRGAERDELLAVLEELEWWYRDLVVLAAGAEAAVVHVDRLDELRADATRERLLGAERACELVRAAWREAEELQLSAPLALEALLVRLRRELAGPALARGLGSARRACPGRAKLPRLSQKGDCRPATPDTRWVLRRARAGRAAYVFLPQEEKLGRRTVHRPCRTRRGDAPLPRRI